MSVPEMWKRLFLDEHQHQESLLGNSDHNIHSPQHTRDILAGGQQESSNVLIGGPVNGSGNEKIFDCRTKVSNGPRTTHYEILHDQNLRWSTWSRATWAS